MVYAQSVIIRLLIGFLILVGFCNSARAEFHIDTNFYFDPPVVDRSMTHHELQQRLNPQASDPSVQQIIAAHNADAAGTIGFDLAREILINLEYEPNDQGTVLRVNEIKLSVGSHKNTIYVAHDISDCYANVSIDHEGTHLRFRQMALEYYKSQFIAAVYNTVAAYAGSTLPSGNEDLYVNRMYQEAYSALDAQLQSMQEKIQSDDRTIDNMDNYMRISRLCAPER